MKILALESSAVSASVALTEDEKLVAQSFQNCGLTHSRTLLPMAENLLANCGVSLADVDAIAVAHGPGSFTGVRIGVATVKALAYALQKKVLGVTSFDVLAYNISDGRKKLAVIDARHDNFYVSGFDENMNVCFLPSFIGLSELKELSGEYEIISDCEIEGVPHIVADVKDGFIKAVEAKLGYASENVETLVPLYVKKSQAEEES